jgi:hypothetical protein
MDQIKKFISKLLLPRGVKIGFSVSPNINLQDPLLQESFFSCKKEQMYESKDIAREKFELLKSNLKKCKLFYGSTTCKFDGEFLQEDTLVAVTTKLIWKIYATSYERVSSLIEIGDYFELCLSACEENIIDGYYRIKVKLTGKVIGVDYIKVQSRVPYLLKLIPKSKYEGINKKSVKLTVDGFFNDIA